MPSTPSDRKRQLQERTLKLRAQIQQIDAKERAREREREKQRESLVGAVVLELVHRGEWPREPLWQALDKQVSSPRERQLLGLPTDRPDAPPAAPKASPELSAPEAE